MVNQFIKIRKLLLAVFLFSSVLTELYAQQNYHVFAEYGLYGVRNGKLVVIEPTYDTIIQTHSKTSNLFIVKQRGGYGLIDEKQNKIIDTNVDSIIYFCTSYGLGSGDWGDLRDAIYIGPSCPANDYFILYSKFWKQKRAYCAATNLILDNWVDSLHYYEDADCFGYYADGKNYVVSGGDMKPLINTPYRIVNVKKFRNEFYFFAMDKGKTGILDKTGKIIFPFKYEYLSMTTPDFIHYWNNGDKGIYGLTNLKQTYTLPVQFTYEWEAINDFYLVSAFEKDSVFTSGIIDKNGKIILPFDKRDLPNSNYLMIIGKRYVVIGKENIYLDLSKEKCEETGFEEIGEGTLMSLFESLIRFKKQGLFGIMDKDGKIVVEAVHKSSEDAWKQAALKTCK